MVPPVPDEDAKPSLEWTISKVERKFEDKVLELHIGTLSATNNVAPVRIIEGIKYAVIKRGLLSLVRIPPHFADLC